MIEVIAKIEEISNYRDENVRYGADGYAITTNKQMIRLLIDNDQDCCEQWGYLMSEDDLSKFIGSSLLDITITDTALSTIQFEQYLGPEDMDAGGMMFVNINTDRGLLQFVAYNAHNGYYGHEAHVISEQLNHSERL